MAPLDVQQSLGLSKPPIAIGFLDEKPAGLPLYDEASLPARCSYWKLALEGRRFVTEQRHHHGCAVGAHTHHIPLPAEKAGELEAVVTFMVEKRYLRPEEVPHIPTVPRIPRYVAYSPASEAAFPADAVVVVAPPGRAMLLYEAALRAGVGTMVVPLLGRPGCAVLPMAIRGGSAALSFGCRGNRTFTGLAEDEMYLCVPGPQWEKLRAALPEILVANAAMGQFYEAKRATPR